MRRYLPASCIVLLLMAFFAAGISHADKTGAGADLKVIAVETFLADVAQNVAGDRVKIGALLPLGADPHTFQATPSDVKAVAQSNVLIVNGAGFEEFLDNLLQNLGGVRKVIDASSGLRFRTPGKVLSSEEGKGHHHHGGAKEDEHREGGDPHFWMSPLNAVHYVENIRKGLSEADPSGSDVYSANADAYIAKSCDS